MEAIAVRSGVTAEEFWRICAGSDRRLELVDGVVVEMSPVNYAHAHYGSVLDGFLGPYARRHKLGCVYLDAGFIIRHDPDVVRGPDVAFVSAERIAAHPPPETGFWPVVPDLAVEVVSPGDSADEVNERGQEYLTAGVRLVWVLYPRRRQVNVHRSTREARILFEQDVLDGEDVVPGFTLPLRELWDA